MKMTVSFERGKATIRDPRQQDKVILTAYKYGRLYKIEEKHTHIVTFRDMKKLYMKD